MWCNQIFSLISGETIQNIIVCDNYEVANQIARINYGEDAYAVDTTQYTLGIGYKHIEGVFYDTEDNIVERIPTEQEEIYLLKNAYNELEIRQTETELESDFRISMVELGLI